MFIPGLPHSFLSHRGNSPLLEFKASRLLGSWDNMHRLSGFPLFQFGKPARRGQVASERRFEMKSAAHSKGARGPCSGQPGRATVISYDMADVMLLASFLVITFY